MSPHAEEAATRAFTRVCDALWRPYRRRGRETRAFVAILRDARYAGSYKDEGGSFLTHVAIASTTAAGCSGNSAWLAFGITAIVTRSGNSSFNSFSVPFGLNGSIPACRSNSGTLPACHQSDCLTFAAATR